MAKGHFAECLDGRKPNIPLNPYRLTEGSGNPDMLITPVVFAIAAVPVAMYLMLIGRFRLSRRPLVTTAWRDTAALGIAIMGLVAIGPMQLFFPTYAAARFAGWVWAMLAALYLLTLLLVVLSCRPKLIVYGLGEEAFFKALYSAALSVDDQSLWHGQVLTMPSVGMQLVTEPTGSQTVQQAVCLSGLTSVAPWMQLERALVKQCAELRTITPRGSGLGLMALGLLLLLGSTAWVMADPASSIKELREFVVR